MLPGTGPAVTTNKSDDDEDQFDDDHDEQCKYDDFTMITNSTYYSNSAFPLLVWSSLIYLGYQPD